MKDNPQLKNKLDDAIKNDDFKDVSDLIEKSVENAIHYTRLGAGAFVKGVKKGFNREEETLPVNRDPSKVSQSATSPNAWFWLRNSAALGGIFSAFGALAVLFTVLSGPVLETLIPLFFLVVLTALFVSATSASHRNMILARDFFRIRREIGDRLVLSTDDIVTALMKPKDEVHDELGQMIQKGYFPQGRLVENGDLLLLDATAYEAYKNHYRGQITNVSETPRSLEEDEPEAFDDDRIEALSTYADRLDSQLQKTKSEALREKIHRLQKIIASIDHAVDNDPERVEALNKFTDYYAPTTVKLIDRYLEFESSAVITDAIRSTMDEIMQSLDTVTGAYERLLDTLYKDDLLELQAEMNVMQTVLTQDGLFEKDMQGDEPHAR